MQQLYDMTDGQIGYFVAFLVVIGIIWLSGVVAWYLCRQWRRDADYKKRCKSFNKYFQGGGLL